MIDSGVSSVLTTMRPSGGLPDAHSISTTRMGISFDLGVSGPAGSSCHWAGSASPGRVVHQTTPSPMMTSTKIINTTDLGLIPCFAPDIGVESRAQSEPVELTPGTAPERRLGDTGSSTTLQISAARFMRCASGDGESCD